MAQAKDRRVAIPLKMAQAKDRRLYDAVCNKCLDEVLKLLNEGVNLEDKFGGAYEKTPLMQACFINATNIALALIEKGANVNAVLYKFARGNTSVATSLIRKTAEINAVYERGQKRSHYVNNELGDFFMALLIKDLDGSTALHLACQNGNAALALILIQNGANVTLRNMADRSPLSYACSKNGFSVVVMSLIHNGAEVNETCGLNKETALHYAAAKNQKDIISVLLQNGADINALNKNGKTPLALAYENQSTDAVEAIRSYAERCANAPKLNPAAGPSSVLNKLDDVIKMIKNVEENVNEKLVQLDKTLQTIITRLEHLETKAKSDDEEDIFA